ncbi:MAG: glycosyltransferase [Candidatus Sulfotelmatobacter sp.]
MSSKTEMPEVKPITFAVAVNNEDVLEKNFLASPCLIDPHPHQILLQRNFTSAAKAYNDAIDKSVNDLIVFCHQDMFFPSPWILQLQQSCKWLETQDPNWGVLGCSGITREREMHGQVYSSGLGVLGQPSEPAEVQTLDEIVLILRKASDLRFDEGLPHFHFYGADICLRAAARGMKSYAISAFCVHNTYQNFNLPNEFYECCEYIRKVWRKSLPIQTTCITISSSNIPVYLRRLRQAYLKHIRRKEYEVTRSNDVRQVFEELTRSS